MFCLVIVKYNTVLNIYEKNLSCHGFRTIDLTLTKKHFIFSKRCGVVATSCRKIYLFMYVFFRQRDKEAQNELCQLNRNVSKPLRFREQYGHVLLLLLFSDGQNTS